MALEWVDGETLETRMARRRQEGKGALVPAEALELLYPAIEALAFAHRQGIVHRDVKPANIMVSDGGHGLTVRVVDFGIAKMMQGEEPAGTGRTRTGSLPAFSPAYAAPEQVTFSRTGPWTDVHALGLIFTELVTGKPPFPDPDASVHEQVMASVRPTPASRGVGAGPLEAVVARAVALAPGDRWKNAGELLEALDRAAGGAPAARPRRSKRRRALVAAAALALLGGGLLIGRARREGAPVPAPPAPAARAEPPSAPPPPAHRADLPAPIPAAAAAAPASTRKVARRTKTATASPAPAHPPAGPKRTDLFDDTK
jgi:serine/threonine-protein kinase